MSAEGGRLREPGPSRDAPLGAEGEQEGFEHRRERIYLETTRHRIEGFLTVAREGYRSRVSDVLNASERDFLTLTDATVEELEGGRPPHRHRFIAIARRHIVLAIAVSDPS